MPSDRALASTRPAYRRKPRPSAGDAGSSLLEVLVSLAVIGTVMAGTAPFLVKSVTVMGGQRAQQVAVEVANNALERARALSPASLLSGRGLTAVTNQLAAAPTQVKNLMNLTQIGSDLSLKTVTELLSGATAPLPTAKVPITVGGVVYNQSWYVGSCWQTKTNTNLVTAAIADCVGSMPAAGLVAVPYYRVVVAVDWTQKDCPAQQCLYVASTLVSPSADPMFDLKRPPPKIASPGAQVGYVDDTVNFQMVATGGTLPRTWSATTPLPPGLTLSSAGVISGKLTQAGTYSITTHVRDRDLNSDDENFTWTVAAAPTLVSPGAQVFRTTIAASLPITMNGGLTPTVWTATGLPNGLTIDAATGVITGKPLAVQTTPQNATVTVVAKGKTASTTFTWRVLSPVTLATLTPQTASKGDPGTYNLAPLAGGGTGTGTYTWKATGLPAGMNLNATTGMAGGNITAGSRYLVTVEITDSVGGPGGTASMIAVVNVNSRPSAAPPDLRITATNTATKLTSTVGVATSLTVQSDGGSGGPAIWSLTGQPPGLTISSHGVVSGKPTTAGTYMTTITVTRGSESAYYMYQWVVNP